MRDFHANLPPTSTVFVGIDLHRRHWHVTARMAESELFSASIEGTWEALQHILDSFRGCPVEAVYEDGYFGYWLHDRLVEYGVACVVTPPSLIPQEAGNRVKTDRLDSRKLARLLSKGMLKRVWVPAPREREHRQVIRRRRQLIQDRVRTQNRVKSELRFYGIELPEPAGYSCKNRFPGYNPLASSFINLPRSTPRSAIPRCSSGAITRPTSSCPASAGTAATL